MAIVYFRAHIGLLTVFVLPFGLASKAGGMTYIIQDLGTLAGNSSNGNAINASGQVAGIAASTINSKGQVSAPSDYARAFRASTNGPTIDLGTIGGTYSLGAAINTSGQIAGQSWNNDGYFHAVRTDPNGSITMASDLGTFGGLRSAALGINDTGETVGWSYLAGEVVQRAFRTTSTGVITATSDLGTFGGDSIAIGINMSGQTVGYSYYPNGDEHAFRTGPNGLITSATDLGTLGGTQSAANEINASGQTVGESTLSDNTTMHAFRTTAFGTIDAQSDLGTLGGTNSDCAGINSFGQIVGSSFLAGDNVDHAWFADTTGPLIDLNLLIPANSGWVLEKALGINDAGQIVGNGVINGQTHGFLLTPIPEPTALSLLAIGSLILFRRSKRCSR